MQVLLVLVTVLSLVCARKEDFGDLEELMNNPELLAKLEKRLGALLSDDEVPELEPEAESTVSCTDLEGELHTASRTCTFRTDEGRIIKTTDSLKRGAEFVGKEDINVSCATDCTMKCCNNSECDTAVYEYKPEKEEQKCYLFRCGTPSQCVFTHHASYKVSSVSEEEPQSHTYLPGGSSVSHETDLENLDSPVREPEYHPTQRPTTTEAHTTVPASKPGLGEYCVNYGTPCADPHAECYKRECSCRAGYHRKYGICRKRCGVEEFECDNEGYGPDARQCILTKFQCDGNKDCADNSDEYNCPKIDKGYKGLQDANIYPNQLFQYPYNNLYGYQAPVLNNQQPAAVAPAANQIYQGQVPANAMQGGQYYAPAFSNQNQGLNNPQTGSQMNNAWTFMDKSGIPVGQAQNAYQNSVPYQNGQQQNFASTGNQGPFVPLMQNPGNQVQQVPVQVQPVINQGAIQNSLNNNVGNRVPVMVPSGVNGVAQNVKPTKMPIVTQSVLTIDESDRGNADSGMHAQEKGQDQQLMNHAVNPQSNQQYHIMGEDDTDFLDDYNGRNDIDTAESLDSSYIFGNKNVEIPKANRKQFEANKPVESDNGIGDEEEYDNQRFRPAMEGHRHSAEEDDVRNKVRTYPPATKSKSQIERPTQSTIPGQKSGHSSTYASERIEDFPIWMQYDNNSPNINAKKGKHVDSDSIPSESDMKSKQGSAPKVDSQSDVRPVSNNEDKDTVVNEGTGSFDKNDDKVYKYNKYDSEDNVNRNYNRFNSETGRRFPSNNRDRRPGYDTDGYRDRYRDRLHRPSPDSRYPYYDNTGYRGRDRYHYPVWDPFRDEYYYPDGTDHRKTGSSHGLDYEEDYRTDKQSGYLPSDKGAEYKDTDKIDSSEHVDKPPIVGQPPKHIQDIVPDNSESDSDSAPLPDDNSEIDDNNAPAPKPVPTDGSSSLPEPEKNKEEENKDTENQPPDDESINSNISDSKDTDNSQTPDSKETEDNSQDSKDTEDSEAKNSYSYFSSANAEKVESYTDGAQGPIVALALGLAITLILLIFVGCRLRTVKRRLRKGRALHSNEADYLINGMYL